jgi:class 3 adenylate cyclase
VSARLTADQVLLVFADPDEAISTALELRSEVEAALSTYGLRAGIGVNTGQVVEGLIGGRSKKIYEVVGDSANIASRICQAAKGGEILVSEPLVRRLSDRFVLGAPFEILVKGKDTKIRVYALTGAVRASDRHGIRARISGGLGRKRPEASCGTETSAT